MASASHAGVISNAYVSPCIGIDVPGETCINDLALLRTRGIVVGVPRLQDGVWVQRPGYLDVRNATLQTPSITVQVNGGASLLEVVDSNLSLNELQLQGGRMLMEGGDLFANFVRVDLGSAANLQRGVLHGGELFVAGGAHDGALPVHLRVMGRTAQLNFTRSDIGGRVLIDSDPAHPAIFSRLGSTRVFGEHGSFLAQGGVLRAQDLTVSEGANAELRGTLLDLDGSYGSAAYQVWKVQGVESRLLLQDVRTIPELRSLAMVADLGGMLEVTGAATNLPDWSLLQVRGGSAILRDQATLHLTTNSVVEGRVDGQGQRQRATLEVGGGARLAGSLVLRDGAEMRLLEGGVFGGHASLTSSLFMRGDLASSQLSMQSGSFARLSTLELRGDATFDVSPGAELHAARLSSTGTTGRQHVAWRDALAGGAGSVELASGALLELDRMGGSFAVGSVSMLGGEAWIRDSDMGLGGWLTAAQGASLYLWRSRFVPASSAADLSMTAQGDGSLISMQDVTWQLSGKPFQFNASHDGQLMLGNLRLVAAGQGSVRADNAKISWHAEPNTPVPIGSVSSVGTRSLVDLRNLDLPDGQSFAAQAQEGQLLLHAVRSTAALDLDAKDGARLSLRDTQLGQAGQGTLTVQGLASELELLGDSRVIVGSASLDDGTLSIEGALHAQTFTATGMARMGLYNAELQADQLRWRSTGVMSLDPTSRLWLKGSNSMSIAAGQANVLGRTEILQQSSPQVLPAQPLAEESLRGSLLLSGILQVTKAPFVQWLPLVGEPIRLLSAGSIDLGEGIYGRAELHEGYWITQVGQTQFRFANDVLPYQARVPLVLRHGCTLNGRVKDACDASTLAFAVMPDKGAGGRIFDPLPSEAPRGLAAADRLSSDWRIREMLARWVMQAREPMFWREGSDRFQLEGLQVAVGAIGGTTRVLVRLDPDRLSGEADLLRRWGLDGSAPNLQYDAYVRNLVSYVGALHAAHPDQQLVLTGEGLGGSLASMVGHRLGIDVYSFGALSVNASHHWQGSRYEGAFKLGDDLRQLDDADRIVNFSLLGDPHRDPAASVFGRDLSLIQDPFAVLAQRGWSLPMAPGVSFDRGLVPSSAPVDWVQQLSGMAARVVSTRQRGLSGSSEDALSDADLRAWLSVLIDPYILRPMGRDNDGSFFDLAVQGAQNYLLDPFVAPGYLIRQDAGVRISHLLMPHLASHSLNWQVELEVGGYWQAGPLISSGEVLTLPAEAQGIRLTLLGSAADLPLGQEMFFNVQFAGAGRTQLHVLELGLPAVPEPQTWLLWLAGIGCLHRVQLRRAARQTAVHP